LSAVCWADLSAVRPWRDLAIALRRRIGVTKHGLLIFHIGINTDFNHPPKGGGFLDANIDNKKKYKKYKIFLCDL
jgi:hypothetical protein